VKDESRQFKKRKRATLQSNQENTENRKKRERRKHIGSTTGQTNIPLPKHSLTIFLVELASSSMLHAS
jgi:hypothetical protein